MSDTTTPPVDPCTEAARLRTLRDELASTGGVKRSRFDKEEVEFHKPDPARLDRLIAQHEDACALAQGIQPKRRRFAKVMRFRPTF